MMIRSEGIVLKYTAFKENSAIVEIFTAEKGLLTFMVSGLNRKSSTFKKAYLYPLAYLEIVFYYKENQNIKRIKEAKLQQICLSLNSHIAKISISQFFAEVLRKSLHEDADEALFSFLVRLILALENGKSATLQHLPSYFLLHLAQHLGVGLFDVQNPNFSLSETPTPENSVMESSQHEYLNNLLSKEIDDLAAVKASKYTRQQLLDSMIHYYETHLPHLGKISSHEKWKHFFAF